jgi:hypothetical protein
MGQKRLIAATQEMISPNHTPLNGRWNDPERLSNTSLRKFSSSAIIPICQSTFRF